MIEANRKLFRIWPLYASSPESKIILTVRDRVLQRPKLPKDLNTFY